MKNALRSVALLCSLLPFAALAGRCPNILLVFDVSGSMDTTVSGTSDNRYTVGANAVNTLLSSNSANFRYGMEMFGITVGSNYCNVSSCYYSSSNTSCQSVLCDYNSQPAISAVLAANGPDGNTPTATAIANAMTRADMQDSTRPRYIILITDGDPNCTSSPVSDTSSAITNAKNAGVKTYVLGFAGNVSAANLNAFATAGGTARNTNCSSTNPCYYNASTPSELQAALDAIVSAVGGELGGGACDDTCYSAGACSTGQVCKAGACVADPCASMSCGAGTYCVEGQCKQTCAPACQNNEYCDNGVCKPDTACTTACTAKNSTCINGQCVEDYCSGLSSLIQCSGTNQLCIKNSCQDFSSGTGGGSGGGTGGSTGTDGGSKNNGGSTSAGGAGCCSGAPDAASVFGLIVALGSLGGALKRRKR